MWQQIKNAVIVVLLSCLIWAYAEQTTTDSQKIQVVLQPEAPLGSNFLVELADPESGSLEAVFRGPRSQLDRLLQEDLKKKYLVNLREVENGQRLLRLGSLEIIREIFNKEYPLLLIEQVDPAKVVFNIDRLVEEKMRVTINPGPLGVKVDAYDPKEVKVRLRQSLLETLEENQRTIFVNLTDQIEAEDLTEQASELMLAVNPILAGQRVVVTPSQIKVKLQIKQLDVPKQLSYPRIGYVVAPISMMGKYRIQTDTQFSVWVKGPASIIEKLQESDIPVSYTHLTLPTN